MTYHKHLLINAKVDNPMTSEDEAIEFLTNLVKSINMKIIKGPFSSYVHVEGNRGLTAMVMIETSHIAFHIWDEISPALLQFDLYTCGALDHKEVLRMIKEKFSTVGYDYMLLDRAEGFVNEEHGFE